MVAEGEKGKKAASWGQNGEPWFKTFRWLLEIVRERWVREIKYYIIRENAANFKYIISFEFTLAGKSASRVGSEIQNVFFRNVCLRFLHFLCEFVSESAFMNVFS